MFGNTQLIGGSALEKRIALISVHGDPAVEFGKEEAGGQNVYVRHVGEILAEQEGWKVDMFTRYADPSLPRIVQHSPNCRTIRLTAGPEEFVPRDELFDHLPEFVEAFLQFQRETGIQYPVIHTNYWLSSWVGMQLRKTQPLLQVHTYHSLGAIKYRSVEDIPEIARTRLNVETECLETADCIVATSPQEEEHMRTFMSEKGDVDIIPCGTSVDIFGQMSREEARKELGIPMDAKVVLYVGRFDKRKGIHNMVRAVGQTEARKDDNLQLFIVGGYTPGQTDSEEYVRIKNIVDEEELSDKTNFTGNVSHDQVLPTYYAAADVCIVPSHYEPFGLVAIEAMASGTPVIASDVGGLKFTVVSEETGLLCPPKDEAAFATAIDRILSDDEWRNKLGANAQKRVREQFSWSAVTQHLNNLYSRLIDERVWSMPEVLVTRELDKVS